MRSKPGPLVGYPDPLLTLPATHRARLTKDNISPKDGQIEYKGEAMKVRRSLMLLFLNQWPTDSHYCVHVGRDSCFISSRQEVHHCIIPLLHGEQLGKLQLSASACSPPSCFFQHFPEHLLLVFPSAKMAEELFSHPVW